MNSDKDEFQLIINYLFLKGLLGKNVCADTMETHN